MAVAFVREHLAEFVKAAGTTDTYALTADVPAGNTLIAVVVSDNAATASKPVLSSISKAAGETNNWVFLGAARSTSTTAGALSAGEMWAIKTTVPWPNATSLTFTWDTSITMKAENIVEFSGVEATLRSTVSSQYSAGTTPATVVSGGATPPVVGDLALGFTFHSNSATPPGGDTDTIGGAWVANVTVGSSGGSGATNNSGLLQHKIVTTTNQQTLSAPTTNAGNGAVVAILQAAPEIAVTQAAYRFYADGTETGSTALANQDTAPAVDTSGGDVNLQVRALLQSTNATAVDATDDFQLQWELNASGAWASVGAAGEVLADSYPSTNQSSFTQLGAALNAAVGQSFLGTGGSLVRVAFHVSATTGTPIGNVFASIYAHTGTFGSTGTATGSPLATSATVACSSITPPAMVDFTFDPPVTLDSGVPYVVAVSLDTAQTTGNRVQFGIDATSPTHAGTHQFFNATSWASTATNDTIFEVYTASSTAVTHASANLTDGAVTTNRLTGGTGSFTAGKVSEDGLADNVGWSGNNFTELLYSVTLLQADLADGDTLRFRVLRNGVTTGLTYTQTPTIDVTAGPPVQQGATTGGYAYSGTASGTKTPRGSATGTYTYAGTSTGREPDNGSTAGGYAYTGSATGVRPAVAPEQGSAAGGYSYAGTATGQKNPKGAGVGGYSYSGAATGREPDQGTATGAWNYTGAATGVKPAVGMKTGTATGGYAYAGTATGRKVQAGTVTGGYAYAGAATGREPDQGAATGGYAYAGSATGAAPTVAVNQGSASGGYSYTGAAVGAKITNGSTTGTYTYTGAAVGQELDYGTASGGYAYAGSAVGVAPAVVANEGTAVGGYSYRCDTATGARVGGPQRKGLVDAASAYGYGHSWYGWVDGRQPL